MVNVGKYTIFMDPMVFFEVGDDVEMINDDLDGGFTYFLNVHPVPGEMVQFDWYFFKWLETTN